MSGIFDTNSAYSHLSGAPVAERGVNSVTQEANKLEKGEGEAIQKVFLKLQEAKLEKYKEENKVRVNLIQSIMTATFVWMLLVLILIVACSRGDIFLSDTVQIVLITTTTTEVLGFMYLVLKYMFHENGVIKEK